MSTTATIYWPIPVQGSFIDPDASDVFWSWEHESWFKVGIDNLSGENAEAARMRHLWRNRTLDKLDNLACINAYGLGQQARGSVLLVVNSAANKTNVTEVPKDFPGSLPKPATGPWEDGSWILDLTTHCPSSTTSSSCEDQCSPKLHTPIGVLICLQRNLATWSTRAGTIQYCLSEQVPEVCRVQSSLHVAIAVIIINLVKFLIMLVLATLVQDVPLVNIGDTVVSFLERPDPYTRWMCLGWRKDFESRGFYQMWNVSNRFISTRYRHFRAVSKEQRTNLFVL